MHVTTVALSSSQQFTDITEMGRQTKGDHCRKLQQREMLTPPLYLPVLLQVLKNIRPTQGRVVRVHRATVKC
jgi:hypothetical protein